MLITTPSMFSKIIEYKQVGLEDVLKDWMQHPIVVNNKIGVPLYNDINFVTAVTLNRNGEICKIGDNILSYNYLILDYDDGCVSVEQAQEMYSDYYHFGYTSYSHTPDVNKFRIILRLDKPILRRTLKTHKEKFIAQFSHVDQTCFSTLRMFFMPSVSTENKKHYECWHSDVDNNFKLKGKFPFIKEDRVQTKKTMNFVSAKITEYNKTKLEGKIRSEMEAIDFYTRGNGVVHNKLLKLNAWMRHEGFEIDEIENIMLEYAPGDFKTTSEIQNIIRKFELK